MLYHNLLLIFRNFKRHRSTFLINLAGLSSGLACVLLITLWIQDEWGMDRFHARDSQLYQVMANHYDSEGIRTIAATPDLLAETLLAELPEVELATSYLPADEIPMKFTLSPDERLQVKGVGQFADKDFFRVFSYPLLLGEASQVLQAPNAIVLSEKMARSIFQTPENAIGKPLDWHLAHFTRHCVVSGVFKDLRHHTSNRFDFLLTIQSFRDPTLFDRSIHWDNHAPNTFLVVKKGTDISALDKKIAGFIKTKHPDSKVNLFLQSYADRYLHDQYEGGVIVGGRITYLKLFGLIALFVLLIACINFMNLSTARASLRMKEVGIKKAIGISRGSLAAQFMGESMVMSFCALLLATGIAHLLIPLFNTLTDKELELSSNLDWVLPFLGIGLITGLVSGSYPALYLSGFKPIAMLKAKATRHAGELWARKGLVVLQFSLSILFLVAVTVVYQQIQLVQTKNMGFNRDQVIRFDRQGKLGDGLESFITELKQIPGVVQAAGISGGFLEATSFTTGVEWPGKQADETLTFSNLTGSYDLIETLDIGMAAGRSFSRAFGADSLGIILNETAVSAMGLKDPIGQTIKLWGEHQQIVGVVKDFHIQSLREPVKPAFFKIDPSRITSILARLEPGKERETIERIQQFHTAFNPGYSFEYNFLNDDFQKQYATENRVSALSKYFAGLAILLSCLGLFGLASFTAEQRTKEIGVRKVLGASVGAVVALLSKDFLKLVLLAILIASPIAYYAMQQWLADFAYRIDIQWWVFVLAGGAAIVVAAFTVASQSVRAARMNPVDSLKNE